MTSLWRWQISWDQGDSRAKRGGGIGDVICVTLCVIVFGYGLDEKAGKRQREQRIAPLLPGLYPPPGTSPNWCYGSAV